MCIIIIAHKAIDERLFANLYKYNPDGWGVFVVPNKIHKSMKLDYGEYYNFVNNQYHVLHFRAATHGSICKKYNHPIKIRNGIWLFHNGVVSEYCIQNGHSDTYNLAKKLHNKPINDILFTLTQLSAYNRFVLCYKNTIIPIGNFIYHNNIIASNHQIIRAIESVPNEKEEKYNANYYRYYNIESYKKYDQALLSNRERNIRDNDKTIQEDM